MENKREAISEKLEDILNLRYNLGFDSLMLLNDKIKNLVHEKVAYKVKLSEDLKEKMTTQLVLHTYWLKIINKNIIYEKS